MDGFDHIFMEHYAGQAGMMTDKRQQGKVKHSMKDIMGIAFPEGPEKGCKNRFVELYIIIMKQIM